jgi:hypothetical protein
MPGAATKETSRLGPLAARWRFQEFAEGEEKSGTVAHGVPEVGVGMVLDGLFRGDAGFGDVEMPAAAEGLPDASGL